MAIKTHKVTLSLDNPRVIQSGINVQSFDKQSIQISIELTKNDEVFQVPSDATIRVSLLKLARQEQKIIVDVPNTNRDSIDWVVPDYLDGYQGTVRVGVYLVSGAENVDLGYFTILSNVSDIDKMADEFTDNVFQGWEQIEADLNELNFTIAQTKLDLAEDLTQIDNTIANINTLASDFTTDVATKQADVTSKYNAFDTDITEANQTIDDILALQPQFQSVLDETTGKDVISAPELIAARNGKSNLKTRLDDEHAEVTAQLAQKASKEEVGEVANDVTTTNNRIDKIISTPTTISEQEIIDARGGKASLGAKIGSIDNRISEQSKTIYDHLYRFGNEFLEKTNGWMEAYKAGSVSGVITKETDHLNISFTNSGGVGDLGVTTSKEIDLTYIDTLYVDWEQTVDSLGIRANILISKYRTQPRSVYDTVSVVNDKFERKISELDVSGFTGLYYIRVHAGNTSSSGSVDLNVYNIYTDKEIVKIDGLLEVNKELDLTNEEVERVKNDVDSHIPLVFDLMYRYGNEYLDKNAEWMKAYQKEGTVGELKKETDHMNINFESTGTGDIGVVTSKKIDLSFIDTIYVDWEQTVDGLSQRIYLIVSEFRTQPHNIFDLRAEEINLVGRRTTALDVSSLTGEYYVRINAFTNSTSALNMNIYNIYTDKEVKENGLLSIPTHWETEYNDSVNKVKNLQNNVGVNGTSFGFITDTHWGLNAKKSHVLLSQLLNDCDIKYYFDGGDIIAGLGIETKEMIIADIEEQKQVFDSISDKRLLVEGNHDAAYSDGGVDYAGNLTLEEFYSIFFRSQSLNDNVVFGNDGTYFYVDDVSQKIRYIGLNALDTPYDVNKMHVFCFRDEQIQWLVNNALEIPNDEWAVVVCSHNIPIESQASIIVNADVVLNVFNAFKNKTSYSGDGTNATYPTSVNVDFTNRGGNFVCWIGGHVHYDYLEVVNGINLVTTLNDSLQIQTNAPVKTQGTDTEQSFDIFTINKITRTVDVTRVGAGTDRTFTY